MGEGDPQCSIAAHGNAADRAARAPRKNAVGTFDVRHELLQKKIAVAHRAIRRVDVKASSAFRRNDEKISQLVLVTQIVEQGPSATVEQRLLVVAEAVQKIKHRIALRRISRRAGIVSRWQVDTVVNRLLENSAVQRVAIDAALRTRVSRQTNEEK